MDSVFIIGGLASSCDESVVLAKLEARSGTSVRWVWVQAHPPEYRVDKKRLFGLINDISVANKQGASIRVVVLKRLQRIFKNRLLGVCDDPVLAPGNLQTGEDLCEWLFSKPAGVFPPGEWLANRSEAALVAILCKLIRSKSWNKDQRGHEWTKEADLLGQAPVSRRRFPEIREEADSMMQRLRGTVLLSKAGGGSGTPKKWCISTVYLPAVKRAITEMSLGPLEEMPAIREAIQQVQRDEARKYQLLGSVVSERVRLICRDRG